MRRIFKNALVVCTLFGLSLLAQAGAASACTEQCVKVGTSPFCRQCRDTGSYTGATCQSSGPCGCFYTQNTCGTVAASASADVFAESIFASAEPLAVASQATPDADVIESALFAQ